MSTSRACAWAATAGLVVTACATTVRVPEIPILDDSVPFKAARRVPDPRPPVRIVEVPKPLGDTTSGEGKDARSTSW